MEIAISKKIRTPLIHMMTWNVTKSARQPLDVLHFLTNTISPAMIVIFIKVDHMMAEIIEQIRNVTPCLTVNVTKAYSC